MPCPRGRDAVYEVRLGDSLSQWSHGVALGGVWRAVGCPFAISAELSIQPSLSIFIILPTRSWGGTSACRSVPFCWDFCLANEGLTGVRARVGRAQYTSQGHGPQGNSSPKGNRKPISNMFVYSNDMSLALGVLVAVDAGKSKLIFHSFFYVRFGRAGAISECAPHVCEFQRLSG